MTANNPADLIASNKRPGAYCFRGPNLSWNFFQKPQYILFPLVLMVLSYSKHTVVTRINVISTPTIHDVL